MPQLSLIETISIKIKSAFCTLVTSCKIIALANRRQGLPDDEFNKLIHLWASKLVSYINLTVNKHDPHQVQFEPGKPYILMCNHTSLYDIPLSFFAFKNISIRMLAKKELSYIPVFGGAMKKMHFPFINRKNKQQAIKDLQKAKDLMEQGIVLWIAPEGTRSKSGQLQPFKKGGFITAIESNATIIPVAIAGAHELLSGKYLLKDHTVDIYVGQPIKSQQADKETLREQTHHAIEQLLTAHHQKAT